MMPTKRCRWLKLVKSVCVLAVLMARDEWKRLNESFESSHAAQVTCYFKSCANVFQILVRNLDCGVRRYHYFIVLLNKDLKLLLASALREEHETYWAKAGEVWRKPMSVLKGAALQHHQMKALWIVRSKMTRNSLLFLASLILLFNATKRSKSTLF